MAGPHGILLIDKPSGPTSHDMVYVVRRGTGQRRVGHAGTLDPLATGLLVVCLGLATRLSEYLAGKDKRYSAKVRLGQATITYDAQGEVVAESAALPGRAQVEAALAAFRGPLEQTPPAFSAVKQGGQRAYALARRGEAVTLAPRPVEVLALEMTGWEPPYCMLDVHCSAGTYVRSLAHDLGQLLGCGAHLAALRRTASGRHTLAEAVPLAELQAAFSAGNWQPYMQPADSAVADWPAVALSAEAVGRVLHGQALPLTPGSAPFGRAYNPAGDFIAVLRADPDAGLWRPDKVFAER